MNKTPLQKLQDEAAQMLFPPTMDLSRKALDAFLVQAYDMGAQAVADMNAEIVRIDAEKQSRFDQCTCYAKAAGYAHTADLHTALCAVYH